MYLGDRLWFCCSYQLGATLGVFSAANVPYLVIPYLVYLTITTLIYTRLIAPKSARLPQNSLMIEHRPFLDVPRWSAIWREMQGTLSQFFTNAIPIFLGMTVLASALDWLGVLKGLSWLINPAMGLFHLPPKPHRRSFWHPFVKTGYCSLLNPIRSAYCPRCKFSRAFIWLESYCPV